MKRSWILSAVFVLVFLGATLGTLPLGFVLDKAGLRQAGLQWESARGSIFSGDVSGLSFAYQPIGTLSLKARPDALLTGKLAYTFHLQGAVGNGKGVVKLGRNQIQLDGFSGKFSASELVYLAPDIRQTKAHMDLQDVTVHFRNNVCHEASGRLVSDVLAKLAQLKAGLGASELSGTLKCDGPVLLALMAGRLQEGDRVTAAARLGLREASSVEVHVQTSDPVLSGGLLAYDFSPEGQDYVYRRQMRLIEGLRQ